MPLPLDPQVPQAPPVTHRDFTDTKAIRDAVFKGVKDAYTKRSIEGKEHRLEFADVEYAAPKDFRLSDEKEAILNRRRLYWNLHGRLRLLDKATGAVISEDEKPRKLAEVPWMTRRGTWIHNGSEYITSAQQRLKPGAYTRVQTNGDVETQFNVKGGPGFRLHMSPETGVFKIQAGQSQLKLYPVLKALGVPDKELVEHWGKDLYNANLAANDKAEGTTLKKLVAKLGGFNDQDIPPDQATVRLGEILAKMKMDPGVNKRTLGAPHDTVGVPAILAATKKILGVHRQEVEADERDDLPYQSFHGPEDFFREHVEKDAGQFLRQALFKAGWKKDTKAVPDGYFTKQLSSVLLSSGLSNALTEINPLEIYDLRHKISRLGEGGLSNTDAVPKGARGVQPTHFGFIDPVRSPESLRTALDLRVAQGAKVGSDGRLYQTMTNARTGAAEPLSTEDIADKTVAFPGELKSGTPKVRAMVGGKMRYVPRDQVDYELPHAGKMWSPVTWMVPLMAGNKGQRVSMGARMMTQALALRDAEAPLVRSVDPDSRVNMGRHIGAEMGAVFAQKGGVVQRVTPEGITVRHDDGTLGEHELYQNFPYNQKGFLTNTPTIKPGQRVERGQTLAKSNYTNEKGEAAIGRNVLTAYHMMDGLTHEDAIVLSESAAKKFASEQMYEKSKEFGEDIHDIGKASFVAKYGSTYNAAQLSKLGDDGVVKVGQIVNKDDPIILAIGKKKIPVKGSIAKGSKTDFSDAAETWDHEEPGEVVDVRMTAKGPVVSMKSYTPAKEGDKLAGCHGNKGIISKIIPDADMLKNADGETIDVVMNPMGVISRVNPSALAEAALGKIARKHGKTYDVEGFPEGSIAHHALEELRKHGMSDTETIFDPKTGRHIKDVFVGVPYVMKLHHMAEGKMSARATGHYTSEGSPAKGGDESSKKMGFMEIATLMAHGVPDLVQDMKMTTGQRNDDYWRMYRQGLTPPTPRISKAYEKLEHTLMAAGVHLRKEGSQTQLLPATKTDIEALAGAREIKNADGVDFETGDPIPGGLFDVGITGGRDGAHWTHIKLSEALPHPLMEDPIRSLLGLTKDKYRDILAGKDDYQGLKGPEGIRHALDIFNVDREVESTLDGIKSGKKSVRDQLVKRLGYLKTLQRNDLHPREFLLDKVPVLPAKFRPVTKFDKVTLSADANYLYKDLFEANKNLAQAKEVFGDDGDARLQLYDAFKAVVGLGDPISVENQERSVRGMLKQITGTSPKHGAFQRKVMGNTLDFVGKAVIAPDRHLKLDEVGLPAEMMWTMFKPFVIRRLVRAGMPAVQAMKAWEDRDTRATKELMAEAAERPVIINRAPTLHKANILGMFAKPVTGSAMRVNNVILKGCGGDFDGDQMAAHVPISAKAVQNIKDKMLPSKMLLSQKDFDVHMLPPQGYVTGLYLGSKTNEKRPTRTFVTAKDALKAYHSGELDADDPVVVLSEK